MDRRPATGDIDLAAEMLVEAVPRLMRLISTGFQGETSENSLSVPQGRTIALVIRGLCLPSELARHMQISPASASELVEGLVRRGLLTRREHETDKRCSPLGVTEAGRQCYETSRKRSIARLRSLLDRLDAGEVDAIHNGLAALLELLPTTPEQDRSSREVR